MHALQRTIDALAKSHNEAATPTLVAVLKSAEGPIFDAAIAGLVARRSKAGHLEVLRQWNVLSAAQKQIVEKGRHRLGAALRDALLSNDDQLFANALDVVKSSADFELLPTLVMVAEQPKSHRSHAAITLTMELVGQLSRAVLAPPQAAAAQRDPESTRQAVLESLERSVERYSHHRQSELIEAFVVLAGPHSNKLMSIIGAPHHPCYKTVIQTLTESTSPGVLQLLTTMLTSKDAPPVIRDILSKRADALFTVALLEMPLDLAIPQLRKNLGKIKSFACCERLDSRYTDQQQAAAMRLVAASGASDELKLEVAAALLNDGPPLARGAACNALQHIAGQRSNELVLTALKDDDPFVQAAAVSQLRDRHIPGTMAKLMALVDSPHEAVSRAARQSLSEFSFDNLLARFDGLDAQARRGMATRVLRVDQNTLARLREEMSSSQRRQRLRALQIAEAMGAASSVADALVERLSDEDHVVRAAAADALRHCTAADVRNALLAAIGDRSVAVQNAARNSLRAMGVETDEPVAAAQQQETPA